MIVRKTYGQAYYGAAGRHLVHEVIDPADTRDMILRFLGVARTRTGIGKHRLANWPRV